MNNGAGFQAEWSQINERIKLENELINQRMSWLSTFQGLLFAAFALAWDKKIGAQPICLIACIIGILVSLSVGLAMYRANVSIKEASAKWDEIKPKGYAGLDPEGVRSASGCDWLMPGSFMPCLFAVMWLCLFVVRSIGSSWPKICLCLGL